MTKKKKLVLVFLGIIVVLIISLFSLCYYFISPVSNDSTEKNIKIPSGSTISDIASILKEEDLIKNEQFFKLYIKLKNLDNIYASSYYLNKSMSMIEIVDTLLLGGHNENEITITFKEGVNIREVANIISSNTNNSVDDVYNTLKDENYLNTLIDKYWFITDDIKNSKIYYSLEGYLFPDTYRISSKDASVEEIFNVMLDEMDNALTPFKTNIKESKYTIHELLTLASITQSEGYNEDDFKTIASVFYNRLKDNMALGSCVTSYYGVKKDMTEELLAKDINSSNPYNTRGDNPVSFPVGPISNPGQKAISAVLKPITTNYYYFVSDKNNKLYFTKNLNEHEKMIQKLQNEGMWYEW